MTDAERDQSLWRLAGDAPSVGDLIVAVLTLRTVRDLVVSPLATSDPSQALVLIGKSVEECLAQVDPQA